MAVTPSAYRRAMATPRRFKPTDAFVDESIRGQRYYMACVLARAHDLPALRNEVTSWTGAKSRRVHFNAELNHRRHALLEEIATLHLQAFVIVCRRNHGVSEFEARERCLAEVVRRLQLSSIDRVVIESRQDDLDDERTIHRYRAPEPRLIFEHRRGVDEPMLWIADGVAWAGGAGPRWIEGLSSTLSAVIEL